MYTTKIHYNKKNQAATTKCAITITAKIATTKTTTTTTAMLGADAVLTAGSATIKYKHLH